MTVTNLLGPWNPSISISSASGSAWLFYFKYTDKDLYAIHCPNDEIESVTSCRNYVLSNETDIIENEDQVSIMNPFSRFDPVCREGHRCLR